jgi:hypothetical protein
VKRLQRNFLAGTAAAAVVAIIAFFVFDGEPVARPILVAGFDGLRTYGDPQSLTIKQYAILRTRGSSFDAAISLPTSGEVLELRVLPEFTPRPARYRVHLFRLSADDSLQSVAELGGLTPEADSFVSVFVDGPRLRPGQYRLTIAGDPDTDARNKENAFILKMVAGMRALNDPSAESR